MKGGNAGSAGQLRERVVWQKRTQLSDGAGGYTHQWVTQGTRHAQVISTAGTEKLVNAMGAVIDELTVTMRFAPNMTTTDRLVWRGQMLNIRSLADPDGRRLWLELSCQSGFATD
jgi:SPP1 family predicted phage head-tail adaptor